jgi:hypothetical protein
MVTTQSEASSRILIDKALEASGWDLTDPHQAEFEYKTTSGRADYLLKDKFCHVLCVLEAKREDKDPYDAKEQARGYAENLNVPFIILSNGTDHWFWNYAQNEQRTANLIPALFHQLFGDPVTNPMDWPVKPFGDLAMNQDGRRRPVKSNDYLFDETSLLIAEDGANLLARSTPIAFQATGKYWVNNHAHIVTPKRLRDLRLPTIRAGIQRPSGLHHGFGAA